MAERITALMMPTPVAGNVTVTMAVFFCPEGPFRMPETITLSPLPNCGLAKISKVVPLGTFVPSTTIATGFVKLAGSPMSGVFTSAVG